VVALGALLGHSSQSADAPGIKVIDEFGREFMHLALAEVGDEVVLASLDIVCVGSLATTCQGQSLHGLDFGVCDGLEQWCRGSAGRRVWGRRGGARSGAGGTAALTGRAGFEETWQCLASTLHSVLHKLSRG